MSVDQVTGLAGGLSGSGLGSVTGILQGGLSNLLNSGQGFLDRFFPPEKREEWKAWLMKFATEKPMLASFLLSQLAISGFPLFLFAVMTLTVFVFAIVAGLLIGLIGALLFIVVALGIALFVLLPTLFFTTAAAVFVWLFGVGSYYLIKWFNKKEVPGIHTEVPGGLTKAAGLDSLPLLNGDQSHTAPKQEKLDGHVEKKETSAGKGTGAQHHPDKEDSGSPRPRKLATKPHPNTEKGSLPDVGGVVGSTTGVVGNTTKKIGI